MQWFHKIHSTLHKKYNVLPLKLDVGNQQQLVSSQASEGRGPHDVGREPLDDGWCLKHNLKI